MIETHLASVDLNLLVVLDVLLEERSVTRAAARLRRTQPAVSRSLGRLRSLLGDPLLVREGGGLSPTPRALALVAPLRAVLAEIEGGLLRPARFDPSTATRSFTLASADYAEWLLMGPLVARVARHAPGVDLVLQRAGALTDGLQAADLAVAPLGPGAEAFRSRALLEDSFACLVRRDHPRVGDSLDVDTFVDLPHVLIAPRGQPGGVVDRLLEQRGLRRRVAVRLATFLVAPSLVAETDLVLTLPRRLALRAASSLPLRVLEPPLPLPGFTLHAAWPERLHHDPGHAWLREQLRLVASQDEPGSAMVGRREEPWD